MTEDEVQTGDSFVFAAAHVLPTSNVLPGMQAEAAATFADLLHTA